MVCNGDVGITRSVNSTMIWYEECFFVLEFTWGRTLQRYDDTAADKEYGIHTYILRGVFAEKCKLVK